MIHDDVNPATSGKGLIPCQTQFCKLSGRNSQPFLPHIGGVVYNLRTRTSKLELSGLKDLKSYRTVRNQRTCMNSPSDKEIRRIQPGTKVENGTTAKLPI